MKKALGILSVLVLITVMMISCNAEQKLDDTVGVSFNVSSSRELSVANESFVAVDSPDLTWYYHGEKKTDTQFITGQSSSMTEGEDGYWTLISKGNKLATKTVEFSQGQWSFKIKAVKTDGTQMYYGETNGNVLLTKGNNTISISVSPFVSGVKGTLVINSVFIDPKDAESENVAPNKLFVNGVEKTFVVDNGGKSISFTESVDPGTYTVEVKRTGEDSGIVLASASKTVVVYSGLTTTISGSVEEDTTSGTFDPKPIKPEGTETVTVSETGVAVVEFVNITPSMEADKSTTVTIPSAVVPSTSNPVTLDIVVKDSESVADSSFDVTTGNGVAASISLTMKNGNTAITNFDSNKVTVETYIETGLSGVTVKYNGTGAAPSDVVYDPVTGKLTFKTTHFSEFYVEANIQAKIRDSEYFILQEAFDAAKEGDTVLLSSNVDPRQTLVVTNRFTLDMNGKTISNTNDIWNDATGDWSLISVRGGNLTVTGEGSLRGKANDCYALDVMNGGTLVIENGTFVGNVDAIYVNEGSLSIKGGEYSIQQKSNYNDSRYLLNCLDENYNNGTATIVVSGGKFHGFNPANCGAEGSETNFMKEWFSAKETTTGVYEVCSAYEDDEINISSAEGLLEFARLVNEEGKTFSGKTVKLIDDINLHDINWIPVGQTGGYTAKTYFQGTFDGNRKTISNLTIPESSWEVGQNDGENYATGFFGFIDAGGKTIKDVTFENANVTGHHWVGVVAGYMTGTVEGVIVNNATVSSTYKTSKADGDKAGGVVGYLNSGSVTGCTVNGSTISAVRDCGSVVGHSNGTVSGNTAENCIVYYSTNDEAKIGGEIAGKRANGVSDNTATNVSVSRVYFVSSVEQLTSALENTEDNKVINLTQGSFTLPSGSCENKNVKFVGTNKDTILSLDILTDSKLSYQNGATLVFENMTIQAQTSGNYGGLAHTNKVTYNNCKIQGKITLYAGTEEFINCTFENKNDYAIWTWGGKVVNLTGCTFNSGGKAVLLYGGSGSTETPTTVLNVTDCVFNDDDTLATDKAAIEIGNDYNATYTLTVNNATVNGFAPGKNTDSKLWANKNNMDAGHLTVTVNGVQVHGN